MRYTLLAFAVAIVAGFVYYRSSITLFYKDYFQGMKRDYFYSPPRIERFRPACVRESRCFLVHVADMCRAGLPDQAPTLLLTRYSLQ